MTSRPADIGGLQSHPDYPLAVPTPDHFLPLLYVAGIAAASGRGAAALVRGCTLGSISMTCYGVGIAAIAQARGGPAAGVPDGVPPDQTNL
jgi:4,5-DOPA dioxygenase extradiol